MADAETPNLPARANDISSIPGLRQVLLLVGIAASVALGVAVVLWSQSPNYSLLYGNLEDRDANQVIEALQAAEIPYRLQEGSGAIMVPGAQVHQARLQLASQGLPQGAGMGVELIQQDQGFGMSQFMENARYHHVLETELSRTITNLQPVQNARVHLALPKQSVFVRDRDSASASVLLHLYSGRRMERDQVASIVHLVASSIPNLDPGQVTVIDQRGRLLSSPEDSREYALTASQFEHTRRVEETYSERIKDLLVPLIGPGRVRAQVVADLDFTLAEETRQTVAPERSAVLSETVAADERRGEPGPSGVPGALSNQPPEEGAPVIEAEATAQETVPVSSSSSSTRNYELDKTISHIRQPTGLIRRLSVAVLVDDLQSINEEGVVETAALTQLELERVTDLVKEAVGFDEVRGDTVKVINASFHSPAPLEPAEEPPFWEKAFIRDFIKQGLGALLVLALAFGLLRPMFRSLMQPPPAPEPPLAVQAGGEFLEAGQAVPLAAAGAPALASVPKTYDEKVAAAKDLVGQDPKQVAQVVKQWVANDE